MEAELRADVERVQAMLNEVNVLERHLQKQLRENDEARHLNQI